MKRLRLRASNHQIKGRVFEVPACAGLLLTGYAPHLEDYYVAGEEIVVYRGRRDLLRQVRALLADEDRRADIARAGYRRTLADHTWIKRFDHIFRTTGLLPDRSGTDGARHDG